MLGACLNCLLPGRDVGRDLATKTEKSLVDPGVPIPRSSATATAGKSASGLTARPPQPCPCAMCQSRVTHPRATIKQHVAKYGLQPGAAPLRGSDSGREGQELRLCSCSQCHLSLYQPRDVVAKHVVKYGVHVRRGGVPSAYVPSSARQTCPCCSCRGLCTQEDATMRLHVQTYGRYDEPKPIPKLPDHSETLGTDPILSSATAQPSAEVPPSPELNFGGGAAVRQIDVRVHMEPAKEKKADF